jgi:hypothetical protein
MFVAVIALIMALSGGAYAAQKYVISSTKQIKPSVLKSLQGKTGATGPAGAAGAKGDNGANGNPGANGTNGTSATTASIPTTSATCNHNGGVEVKSAGPTQNVCNGQTGFTETLPSGKTETGRWATPELPSGPGLQFIPISFNIPLAGAPPTVVLVETVGEHEAECPGTFEEPKATAGNLCAYALVMEHIESFEPAFSVPTKAGANLAFHVEAGAIAFGSWAVTPG